MAATRQRVLQQRVPAGLRLRSSSYPYRSACIMSSAVAALLLCTPTSGFMPAKSHHSAPPMLRQASVQGPKSPVWSLGQLVRGYASRVGGRRVQPLNLKGTVSSRDASTAAASLIQTPAYKNEDLLVKHPKLISGSLPNGFRYCIFNNKKPLSRFYANLEVHVGSVDEEEHERGIAHYLEHMVFLGTEKHSSNAEMKKIFTRLGMAFNADANAYTDFRSTVYTLSAPTRGKAKGVEEGGGAAMFGGQGPLSTAGAVQEPSEEEEADDVAGDDAIPDDSNNVDLVLDLLHQMMFKARIEQTAVDSERGAILSEARDRNSISTRVAMDYYSFFHGDTMLPTRFPIGLVELIKTFSAEEIRTFYEKHYNANNMCLYIAGDFDVEEVQSAIERVFGGEKPVRGPSAKPTTSTGAEPCLWEPRGMEIKHDFASIKPGSGGRVKVNSHDQIQDFSASFSVKEPYQSTKNVGDLRESLVDTIVGFTLDNRVRSLKLAESEPKFQGISWSYTASRREGCSTNSFSVSSLPKFWREAVVIGAREAKRLELYGVTPGELHQAKTALVNSLAQQVNLKDSQSSSSWLSKVMGCVQDGDQLMDPVEKQQVLSVLLEEVSLEEINERAKTLFKPVTDFADTDKAKGVAFVSVPLEWDGVVPFDEEELKQQLRSAVADVEAPDEGVVPSELVPHEEVVALAKEVGPTIVRKEEDEETGVVRGELSNGMRFNYRRNTQRPNEINIRCTAIGGRSMETKENAGSVLAGLACWLNGGFGGYKSETIGQFMTMNMLQHDASCQNDALAFDMKIVTTVPGNLNRGLGVFRLLLTEPGYDGKSLERFKQRIERAHKALGKSIERSTAAKFFEGIMADDDRWKVADLKPETTNKFTPESVRQLIDALWTPDNMELAVSGDFEPCELEAAITTYLGTLPPSPEGHVRPWEIDRAKKFSMRMAGKPGFDDSVRTNDDVSRSYAVMGFPSVNRWGKLDCDAVKIDLTANMLAPSTLSDGSPYDAKMHPNRVLSVASEIVTNVLFEEIRTKRGLVYGISFAIKPYKHTESGIASISFMPKEEQVEESIAAVKEVMARIVKEGFSETDFLAVKEPLVLKAKESEVTNGLWLMLMEDIQAETNPKDMLSIRRVADHYEAITLEHVNSMVKQAWGHCVDTLYVAVGKSGPGLKEDGKADEANK